MKPFRFRAAAVLDIRRHQEDQARLLFAKAEAIEREASARAADVERAREEGRLRAQQAQQENPPAWLIGWHQTWMMKQRLDLQARRRDLAVATAASADAGATLRAAHRGRLVIERLRDRAWRMYQLESGRHETREM